MTINGNIGGFWVGGFTVLRGTFLWFIYSLEKKYMIQPFPAFHTNCYLSRHLRTKIILDLSSIHLQIKQLLHRARSPNQFMYYANSRGDGSSDRVLTHWAEKRWKCASNADKSRHGSQMGAVVTKRGWGRDDADALWNEKTTETQEWEKNWNVWTRLIKLRLELCVKRMKTSSQRKKKKKKLWISISIATVLRFSSWFLCYTS